MRDCQRRQGASVRTLGEAGRGLIMMTEDDVGIESLKLAFIFGTLHTIYDHLLVASSTFASCHDTSDQYVLVS